MSKMRVSYSILSAWDRGDWDRAIAPFVGREIEGNEFMQRGKRWHKRWEKESRKTGKIPAIFGDEKLVDAQIEGDSRRVRQINDWLELSGVLDRIDKPEWLLTGKRGIDYKLSKQNAVAWANSKQGACYKILYPELSVFEFHCHNPYLKKGDPDATTMSIVHLTDKVLEEGLEWVLTTASDLRAYLEANNISIERVSTYGK